MLAGALVGALVLRSGLGEHIHVEDVETSLRDRRLWRVCGASGLYLIAQIATMSFLVLFLVEDRGWSTGAAAAVLAAGQVLAAGLRIGVGRWSDVDPLADRAAPARGDRGDGGARARRRGGGCCGWILVPILVATTGLSMAWNGLSFTIAAELGGRRSGAAIGFQQTVLSLVGIGAPIAFAATVSATSWRAAFALAAVFPLAGWWALRPLRDR